MLYVLYWQFFISNFEYKAKMVFLQGQENEWTTNRAMLKSFVNKWTPSL